MEFRQIMFSVGYAIFRYFLLAHTLLSYLTLPLGWPIKVYQRLLFVVAIFVFTLEPQKPFLPILCKCTATKQ